MTSPNLRNLAAIGRLKAHQPTAVEVQRLLAAAERNLRDAGVQVVSDETRFDDAYKAVMQSALVGMMLAGYRPSTSEPGHHQTLIQTLGETLQVPPDTWVLLDALRRRRNANDYTGDIVTPDMVAECTRQAAALLALAQAKVAAASKDLRP